MFYKDYLLPLFFSAASIRMACSMLPVFAEKVVAELARRGIVARRKETA